MGRRIRNYRFYGERIRRIYFLFLLATLPSYGREAGAGGKRSINKVWEKSGRFLRGFLPVEYDLSIGCNHNRSSAFPILHHFFDIDESQARGPSARVRLSKIAGRM